MRDWRRDVLARLAALRLDPASEAEIVEELAQHLEDQFNEMCARGAREADVERALLDQLASPQFSAGVMSRRGEPSAGAVPIGGASDMRGLLTSMWQDVRYGLRALRRSPAFSTVAILSLALGIGANTAIFGLLNAVLLERLPLAYPEQLVSLQWTAGTKKMVNRLTYAEYAALKATPSLPTLTAAGGTSVTIVARNARDYSATDVVAGGYFEVLGLRPLLGRTISADDDARRAPVVVISEDFWRQRFAADPAVLGQTVTINDQPFTIIGVLPAAFRGVQFAGTFSMAVPIGAAPLIGMNEVRDAQHFFVSVIGRLRPDMTLASGAAAVNLAHRRCCPDASGPSAKAVAEGPGGQPSDKPQLVVVDASRGLASPKVDLRGEYRRILIVLMAGVAIVLLIACANVGNLLLARGTARRRELAVRISMGATRSRIIRQLLTESLELAIAGGALGLLFARLGTSLLSHNLPPIAQGLSEQIELRPSMAIVGFTALVTLGCTLLFGVFPAVRATRADLMTPLKDGGRGNGRSRLSLDRGLVVAQVALALVLVCAATLFVATLRNLRQFDGGYRTTHVLLAYLDTRGTAYETRGMNAIYPELLQRAAHIPGVEAVAAGMQLPVFGGRRGRDRISVPGYEASADEDMSSSVNPVTPGFLSATGIGLRAGREFDAQDLAGSERVAIVNQAFAKRFFAGRDPIGGSIVLPGDQYQAPLQMRIVGVANDARYEDLRAPATELFYVPVTQDGNAPLMNFALRTSGDPNTIASSFTRETNAVAPGIRMRQLVGLEQVLDEALARERLSAALATMFGLIALGLAAVGLYGVVAYTVARRTSEIGIRMALGATPADALWLVVRQTLAMTLVGVAIGTPLAFAAAKSIGAQLYGIGASDPRALIGGALLLGLAGTAASIVPGRRAARIDPVDALRAD